MNCLEEVMTTGEADEVWGFAKGVTKLIINEGKFKEGEYRKSGNRWLVTRQGMNRVFGPPRTERRRQPVPEEGKQ